MLDHIIAKKIPRETLIFHTNEIIKRWVKLKNHYQEILEVDELFWKYSFLSVLFHDLGKVALNFQDKIHDRVHHFDDYIRHEMLSGILLLYSDKDYFVKHPSSLLAVFSHHKPLIDGELFKREKDRVLRVNKVDLDELVAYISTKFKEHNITFVFESKLLDILSKPIPLEVFYKVIQDLLKNAGLLYLNQGQVCRREYIYYKAILNTADWSASGHQELGIGFSFTTFDLEKKVLKKLADEGKVLKNFEWKKFQKECLSQSQNVLAIAPTGSGKTEAALLWATQKKSKERIIYLLPTRVTSNSIYGRLCKYFSKDNTAVVHSSAFFYQKELDDSGTYHKGDYLVDKTFFKNVNVCTIDQVLTQGFNVGYWEIKTFNMLNSWVIIDEIHLYAPYTLGLIISSIKYLKTEFNARFFIMTATMPKKLQTLLKETLDIDESAVVRDQQLLDAARNTFEVRDCLADEVSAEIIEALNAKRKVLIVVNTVNECIRLYSKFNGIAKKTICYHSRFIQKDRLSKEREILASEKESTSLLLIATQVVEVSLDIDFDILFTENAPIDAIIQRAGRVNRGRKKENTKVIVFREQDVTKELIYTDVEGVIENTFKELKKRNGHRLSENELNQLVDLVYKDYDVQSQESYIEALNIYEKVQRGNHYVKDNNAKEDIYTRAGLDTISVIPMTNSLNEKQQQEQYFTKEFFEKLPMEKSKYELSIRRKKQFTHKVLPDEFGFNYIDAKYDFETGLKFKQKDDSVTLNY